MTALEEAKKKVRYLTYEQRGFQIEMSADQADQLRDAIDLVLQRLNRVESIVDILKRLEEIS